jgi:hypothetical protein
LLDLGYLGQTAAEPLLVETSAIGGMLYALRAKVEEGGSGE